MVTKNWFRDGSAFGVGVGDDTRPNERKTRILIGRRKTNGLSKDRSDANLYYTRYDGEVGFFFFIYSYFGYHVSRLLNFLVTTLPTSIPNRSTIRCAKSGCDVPLNTLMLGILLLSTNEGVETESDSGVPKQRARTVSVDNKGILPPPRPSYIRSYGTTSSARLPRIPHRNDPSRRRRAAAIARTTSLGRRCARRPAELVPGPTTARNPWNGCRLGSSSSRTTRHSAHTTCVNRA